MTSTPIATVRALHLLPHQGVGGLARSVIELVRHERMDGAQDELVLTERALETEADFMAPATPAHFLGLTGEPIPTRGARLAALAASRGARVVHAHGLGPLRLAYGARRGGGPRYVATLHELPPSVGFLERRRLRAALLAAEEVWAVSPAIQAAWAPSGRAPVVAPLAVDVQRFQPSDEPSAWRAARVPEPGTLLVGSLMRAAEGKDHGVLVEAVRRRSRAGRPTALLLVGDGPRFEERRALAQEEPLLHVRRRVLDAPGFFSALDVFALHASDELAPLSMVEALACARPVVFADGAAPSSGPVTASLGAARDAGFARGVRFGDVDAVVQALDAWAEPGARAALGALARRHATEHHALQRLRARLAPHYV
ncbi:MAG: glycosyltransferase [Planctomycetota bacterium]